MFEEDQQPEEQNTQDSTESFDSSITPEESSDIPSDDISIPADVAEEPIIETPAEEIPQEEEQVPVFTEQHFEEEPVMVQPVQFTSFDEEENIHGKENRNLDLLMNVNLQMSVELGRTELPFKKVLELTRGSIISLDKLAGEPVELFANGKLVAYGEVVVIEDNFGLRITSIAAPEERLKTIHDKDKEKDTKETNK